MQDAAAEGGLAASLTGALREALRETRQLLFSPVRPERWLVLALPAWLSLLGVSGINVQGDWVADEKFLAWWREEPVAGWTAAGLLVLALLAAGLAMAWLRARGLVVLLDCLVRSEVAVRAPWRRLAAPGNRLFLARLAVSVPAALFVAALVLCAVFFLRDGTLDGAGLEAEEALLFGCLAGAGVAGAAVFGAVFVLMDDVFCPLLLSGGGGIRDTARAAWALAWGHADDFLAYLLFRAGMLLAACVVAAAAACATCCIAVVPYVGTVILLPLHVAWRYYPLFFLKRLGCDVWTAAGAGVMPQATVERVPPRLATAAIPPEDPPVAPEPSAPL